MNEIDNNPSHWKLGLFYYNKNDKRIFPPKRIKYLGWTINFANPYSILAFIGLLFLILLTGFFLDSSRKNKMPDFTGEPAQSGIRQ